MGLSCSGSERKSMGPSARSLTLPTRVRTSQARSRRRDRFSARRCGDARCGWAGSEVRTRTFEPGRIPDRSAKSREAWRERRATAPRVRASKTPLGASSLLPLGGTAGCAAGQGCRRCQRCGAAAARSLACQAKVSSGAGRAGHAGQATADFHRFPRQDPVGQIL